MVCGAHLRLLAAGTVIAALLAVTDGTMREAFLCIQPLVPITRLDRPATAQW